MDIYPVVQWRTWYSAVKHLLGKHLSGRTPQLHCMVIASMDGAAPTRHYKMFSTTSSSLWLSAGKVMIAQALKKDRHFTSDMCVSLFMHAHACLPLHVNGECPCICGGQRATCDVVSFRAITSFTKVCSLIDLRYWMSVSPRLEL